MRMHVETASPQWAVSFEGVAAALRRSLEPLPNARIEHVGSTAVAGLAAKPILDIDVLVPRETVGAAVGLLEQGGYRSRGDLGIAERIALAAPDDDPLRHVYVCPEDSLAARNHLAVRDALRASDALRDEYARLKLELAERSFSHVDEYVAAKSPFLQRVLAEAGLSADDLAAIGAANGVGPV